MSIIGDLYRFIRFSASGATGVLPLLGAASSDPDTNRREAATLLAVAATFHIFAYVHNDIIDLELDRLQPLRSAYPLVRGTISPNTALGIALLQPLLALILDRTLAPGRGSPTQRRLRLTGAFAGLACYNLWGKRCRWPILTDLIQGIGWSCLISYGAWSRSRPTRLTRLLYAYEVILIMLVNGIHGGLRDLSSDMAGHVRTTAIWLRACPTPDGRLHVPQALIIYALTLQAILLAVGAAALKIVVTSADPTVKRRAISATGTICLALAALPIAATRNSMRATDVGMVHLSLILSVPPAIIAPTSNRQLGAILLLTHMLPLLANGMTYSAVRRMFGWIPQAEQSR
jgi:4-hydroxybenzoate polyprenyltransferase